jgi:hypothetical protein
MLPRGIIVGKEANADGLDGCFVSAMLGTPAACGALAFGEVRVLRCAYHENGVASPA